MKTIAITATRDALAASSPIVGCAHDHLSTILRIALDADLQGTAYTYQLAFETADGYRCLTELLVPNEAGELTFAIPHVLMVEGSLQMQLVVYQNEVILHTPKCTPSLMVAPSIEPDTELPADFTGLIYPGVGIADARITDGHLIIRYQDGTTQDAGLVSPGQPISTLFEQPDYQQVQFSKATDIAWQTDTVLSSEGSIALKSGVDATVHLNGVDVIALDNTLGAIHNVADPVADTDAANKRYVDDHAAATKMDKFGEVRVEDYYYRIDTDLSVRMDGTGNIEYNASGPITFSTGDSGAPILLDRVSIWPADNQEGICLVQNVADPTTDTDVSNKRYVDGRTGWKTLVDTTLDDTAAGKTSLMLPLDPAVATMSDFKMMVRIPFSEAVTAGAFYIKAFLTTADLLSVNTLFSRSSIAISAGGRLLISSYATKMGDDMLYTTDTMYTATGGARSPYTALQNFDESIIAQAPYVWLTLSDSYTFPAGTRVLLQGR